MRGLHGLLLGSQGLNPLVGGQLGWQPLLGGVILLCLLNLQPSPDPLLGHHPERIVGVVDRDQSSGSMEGPPETLVVIQPDRLEGREFLQHPAELGLLRLSLGLLLGLA